VHDVVHGEHIGRGLNRHEGRLYADAAVASGSGPAPFR
jgi:hypothetical protein